MLLDLFLVFAVFFQHQVLNLLLSYFFTMVLFSHLSFFLLRLQGLKGNYSCAVAIDSPMQFVNLIRVPILHFLELSVEVIFHQFEVFIILFSDFDEGKFLFVCRFGR
jgi:hypothetical protein